jgi:tetratricopeptide (TPR) repeat protein
LSKQQSFIHNNMSSEKSNPNIFTSSDAFHPRRRIVGNYFLVWLDVSIDQSNQDCQNILAELRDIVSNVNIFTQPDQCIDFLSEVDDIKAFMIVTGAMGQQIIPLIHDIPHLDEIYLYCPNKTAYEQWAKQWVKVKGVHTGMTSIYEALQLAVKQCNQDSIGVSFLTMEEVASSGNLDQLEPTFMYTQLFKEILLSMEYDRKSIKDFTTYCRNGDYGSPSNINRFENEYNPRLAIWWYTFSSLIFSMLNAALRLLEADTIINMGFIIRDLHHQIERLHQQQLSNYRDTSFIVYRGQGLSKMDFEKLLKSKRGLISFNNFLSTSTNREISIFFAESTLEKIDTVGILFKMTIDPCMTSAPFASIHDMSSNDTEEEILFSMHTVFRIGDITKMDNNKSLYQVDLTLTSDDDQQLRTLTNRIREEAEGNNGWTRLGTLLLDIGQFNKAEELYNGLLEKTSKDSSKASCYNNLGLVKFHQGEYGRAIGYYEKALEIHQKTLPSNHTQLAILYSNIGGLNGHIGVYPKALSFHEKALEIQQKSLPPNHPLLATCYNNIAVAYHQMAEWSKALSFYKKVLDIQQKSLPPNHPSLANFYNNIAITYLQMGEYLKARSFYEKALQINEKSLPPNHPSSAASYNSIGEVYRNMGEYAKALSFFEKTLDIRQKTLPPNHPDSAESYNNIGTVYRHMGEYSKALSFYEKVFEICRKTLPENHPLLATCYCNTGLTYMNTRDYSNALSFYEKAREIFEKTLPPDHPNLAACFNNIGGMYENMAQYSKALSFYEKAVEIDQKTLTSNHPNFANSYNNIGAVYSKMSEYSTALSFYKKATQILERAVPANHPYFASTYNNIGDVYKNTGEYSNALSFYEKALAIFQKTLPPNHPTLAKSYNYIGTVYMDMGELSKALSYLEHALDILQNPLPTNRHSIQNPQQVIEIVKKKT